MSEISEMAYSKSIPCLNLGPTSGYSKTMIDRLSNMQRCSKFTDFIIKVKDKNFSCHRNILSAACDYFDALFESGMKEAETGELCLHTMKESVVESIIQYLYGQYLNIPWEDIQDFLDAVEFLTLKDVKIRIDKYINQQLNPENCLELYGLAERYQLKNTLTGAKRFLTCHFYEVGKTEGFISLDPAKLIEILSEMDVSVYNGDDVLRTCLAWVLAEEDSRKDLLSDLLAYIDVTKCSPSYLKHVLDTYTSRLINDVTVYAQINKGITASITPYDVNRKRKREPYMTGVTDQSSESTYHKAVMIGGWTGSKPFKKLIQIDFLRNTCTEIGALPTQLQRRHSARCVTPWGVFSAGGGIEGDRHKSTKQCFLFVLRTHNIRCLPDLPCPFMYAASVAMDTHLYVMCGCNTEKTVLRLDVNNMSAGWENCSEPQHGVSHPIAWCIGRKIYVLSRTISEQDMFLQCYDTTNNTWQIKSPPPAAVTSTLGACHVLEEMSDEVYIMGIRCKLVVRYKSSRDQWDILFPPEEQHIVGCAVYKVDGKIILCHGICQGHLKNEIEEYTLSTNTWRKSSLRLPAAVYDHFLVKGGKSSQVVQNSYCQSH